jgi:putative SOS response-associated peptidase YedK
MAFPLMLTSPVGGGASRLDAAPRDADGRRMCGRFALTSSPSEIEALFALIDLESFPPRYNIAPTQPILMIAGSERLALLVRWGLIPAWVKDPRTFTLLFNARSEGAEEKASFRAAMRYRRTLIPASGFYEWRRDGQKRSQPCWVRPKHGGVIAFAGLMETYLAADGSEIDTGAILTTAANADIAHIHDRAPVVIQPGDFSRWLNCRNEPAAVADLMQPAEPGFFEAIPVSHKVNKADNMGPELQERLVVADWPPEPVARQMSLF